MSSLADFENAPKPVRLAVERYFGDQIAYSPALGESLEPHYTDDYTLISEGPYGNKQWTVALTNDNGLLALILVDRSMDGDYSTAILLPDLDAHLDWRIDEDEDLAEPDLTISGLTAAELGT